MSKSTELQVYDDQSTRGQSHSGLLDYPVAGLVEIGLHPGYAGWVFLAEACDTMFPMHRHSELEFNLVMRGSGTYLIDGRLYDIEAGDLIWLFPSQNHILLDKSSQFAMWVVYVSQGALHIAGRSPEFSVLQRECPTRIVHRHLSNKQARKLDNLLEDLRASNAIEGLPDVFNAGVLYACLMAWKWQLEQHDGSAGKPLHKAVAAAIDLIQQETESLSQDVIASRVGMSSWRLGELFREQVGITLLEFRDRTRMERFFQSYNQHIHAESESPQQQHPGTVLRSALEAGFGSYRQFFRVFSRIMGSSPREYLARYSSRSATDSAPKASPEKTEQGGLSFWR